MVSFTQFTQTEVDRLFSSFMQTADKNPEQVVDQQAIGTHLKQFLTTTYTSAMKGRFLPILQATQAVPGAMAAIHPGAKARINRSFALLAKLYATYADAIMIECPANLKIAVRRITTPTEIVCECMNEPFPQFLGEVTQELENLRLQQDTEINAAVGSALTDFFTQIVGPQFAFRPSAAAPAVEMPVPTAPEATPVSAPAPTISLGDIEKREQAIRAARSGIEAMEWGTLLKDAASDAKRAAIRSYQAVQAREQAVRTSIAREEEGIRTGIKQEKAVGAVQIALRKMEAEKAKEAQQARERRLSEEPPEVTAQRMARLEAAERRQKAAEKADQDKSK